MHTSLMLPQTRGAAKASAAGRTFKRLLSFVRPFMRDKGILALQSLRADAALELGLLMAPLVSLDFGHTSNPFSAELALILLICTMFQNLVLL